MDPQTLSRVIVLTGTKDQIEHNTGTASAEICIGISEEGELGVYSGGKWEWIKSGGGRLLLMDGITDPPAPLTSEDGTIFLYGDV